MIQQISNSIHELIVSNFYTRLIDWVKITELEENEVYEVRLYKNFITTEELGIKEFEEDIKEIVKRLEEKTLMKVNNKYFINIINKVDVVDDTLEIVLISERLKRKENIT